MAQVHFDQSRDLRAVLGPLSRGRQDPAYQYIDGALVLTGLNPEPFTVWLRATASGVDAEVHGAGAQRVADMLPDLLGAGDDPSGFVPGHPLVDRQWRRYRSSWRVPRTLLTWQIALAAVLEQRVTGKEARAAWRGLLTEHGSAAPGAPDHMRVPPTPRSVLAVPSWDWRRYGVDKQRVTTIREVARAEHVLAAAEAMAPAAGRDALCVIPGVGAWTAAEISCRAFGDADAVSVGDYHLAQNMVFALTGELGGSDERMLDLLAPYAGHRHRVVRMVELAGVQRPRRGPRMRMPGPRGFG